MLAVPVVLVLISGYWDCFQSITFRAVENLRSRGIELVRLSRGWGGMGRSILEEVSSHPKTSWSRERWQAGICARVIVCGVRFVQVEKQEGTPSCGVRTSLPWGYRDLRGRKKAAPLGRQAPVSSSKYCPTCSSFIYSLI